MEMAVSLRVFAQMMLHAALVVCISFYMQSASAHARPAQLHLQSPGTLAPAPTYMPHGAPLVAPGLPLGLQHSRTQAMVANPTALQQRPPLAPLNAWAGRREQGNSNRRNQRRPLTRTGVFLRVFTFVSLWNIFFGGSGESVPSPPAVVAEEVNDMPDTVLPMATSLGPPEEGSVDPMVLADGAVPPPPEQCTTTQCLTSAQEFRINSLAGFIATMVSAALTFPIDTLKTRLQAGKPGIPPKGGVWSLYNGLIPSMIVFCPTVSIFVGLSYWIKDQIMGFPFITHQHLLAGMIAGAVSNIILSMYRVPTSMMIKLIQTEVCDGWRKALDRIFFSPGAAQRLVTIWIVVLFKDIPNGALRMGIYQFYEECVGWMEVMGMSVVNQRIFSGVAAGMTLGLIANPIDLVVTRAMTSIHDMKSGEYHFKNVQPNGVLVFEKDKPPSAVGVVSSICRKIYRESGIRGFFAGAMVRSLARIPSTCIWFAVFDFMKIILGSPPGL